MPTDIVTALLAEPRPPAAVATEAPLASGLYAWWAAPSVLPAMPGPAHPTEPELRLLYVGIATRLRTRLAGNHLRRTGSSTLRRTLAGLLLDQEQFQTRWTDRVVLAADDESRLTRWMEVHLQVSWCTHPTPRDVEPEIIRSLQPPLNVDHAAGPVREVVIAARRRFYASAGAS